ncbi:MAG: ABC transporter ATP-binding protein [Calditrichaceae bacterium]
MIKMENISRVYDTGRVKVDALKEIDLHINRGEFVAIMGPSGSGKSTLMNMIGCLDTPTSGNYFLDGKPIQKMDDNNLSAIRNHKIGFVFQNFNLLPYATAYENVELPLILSGMSANKRKPRVVDLLKRVGLENRMDHKPNELSGGQQQRVAIARALANAPRIILADEPTGNLDSHSGQEIVDLFTELWRQGNTILMITHDPEISDRCPRQIHLKDGMIVEDKNEH